MTMNDATWGKCIAVTHVSPPPPPSAFPSQVEELQLFTAAINQSVWKSALLEPEHRWVCIQSVVFQIRLCLFSHCVCVCVYIHSSICAYYISVVVMLGFQIEVQMSHGTWTWKERWRQVLWKERNPLIILVFSCVVLFYHILPPSSCVRACMCVCVFACIKAAPSHSSLFLCPIYITLSLPPPSLLPPTPLPPAFILNMSDCSPAIPSVSIQSILLHHASACLKKWRSNQSNQEHRALCSSSAT